MKIKSECKKVDEAEINLMINIGFDLNLDTGMTVFYQWQKMIGSLDSEAYQKASKFLSDLYQTTLCIYYEP